MFVCVVGVVVIVVVVVVIDGCCCYVVWTCLLYTSDAADE